MTNFERFYITWYSRAIHFAREYVLSESDAENIVQDVFLHLYEHCDRLDAYTLSLIHISEPTRPY